MIMGGGPSRVLCPLAGKPVQALIVALRMDAGFPSIAST
jgi:hypothetical protein